MFFKKEERWLSVEELRDRMAWEKIVGENNSLSPLSNYHLKVISLF